MANEKIREAAKAAGVHLWEVAEAFGVNDGNFSRKLRHEFNDEERERVLAIIEQIKAGREA